VLKVGLHGLLSGRFFLYRVAMAGIDRRCFATSREDDITAIEKDHMECSHLEHSYVGSHRLSLGQFVGIISGIW